MQKTIALGSLAAGCLMTALLALSNVPAANGQTAPKVQELKPASGFTAITDEKKRSVALFEEAGKVILHPRCVNCHPATQRPTQNMAMTPHQPPVARGEADMGVPGMTCNTCHGTENVKVVSQAETIKSIPGHPNWHVADRDGLAEQVAGRDLRPDQGPGPQRRQDARPNHRAHGA